MASARTYFKLGLFVLLGLAGLVAAAITLGVRSVRAESVPYHTYFDESVQGLDVGAPVKYRGVSIGSVAATEIAPDRRHVDVTLALKVDVIRRLGLVERDAAPEPRRAEMAVPPELRAQLGSQGITGVKFVSIDFFEPKTTPVEPLPFPPAEHTIPAAPSLVKSLEDSIVDALSRLPAVLDRSTSALTRLDALLSDFQEEGVPAAVARTLRNLDGTVTDLRGAVKRLDQSRLPEKAAQTIEHVDLAVTKMHRLLDRLDGDAGLVASTTRATDSVGALGRTATGTAAELERTLRDLGDAARSVRDLADALERDPDMLLKGKSRPRD